MPAASVYMRVNEVQKKWIFNARVIGDVDCCVCVWGTTGVKSALAITANQQIPVVPSSPSPSRRRQQPENASK